MNKTHPTQAEADAHWNALAEEAEREPTTVDVLDYLACNLEGWGAIMASRAYFAEIATSIQH